jgi:hypothetical protein
MEREPAAEDLVIVALKTAQGLPEDRMERAGHLKLRFDIPKLAVRLDYARREIVRGRFFEVPVEGFAAAVQDGRGG